MKQRNIGIVLTAGGVGVGITMAIVWLAMVIFEALLGPLGTTEALNAYGAGISEADYLAAQQILMRIVGVTLAVCAIAAALGIGLILHAGKEQATIPAWAYVKKGWEITKQNIGLCVKIVLFMLLVNIIIAIPAFLYEDNIWVVQISDLFSSLANLYIEIGFVGVALLLITGKKADFNSLFISFKTYVNFVVATVLYSIIVGLGLILFIIPGIYFSLKYQLFPFFIIERKSGIFDALRLSGLSTRGVKLDMLLLGMVLQGITLLSMIPLGLGLLITIPLALMTWTLVYKKVESQAK